MPAGYVVLIGGATLTFTGLLALGTLDVADFMGNPEPGHLTHPTGRVLSVSGFGALAGGLVIAARCPDRFVSLVIGRWDLAVEGAGRFGLDVVFVVAGCGLVFGLKQAFVHHRERIV